MVSNCRTLVWDKGFPERLDELDEATSFLHENGGFNILTLYQSVMGSSTELVLQAQAQPLSEVLQHF